MNQPSALERAFTKLGAEEINLIFRKIELLDIKGPTVEEYFDDLNNGPYHWIMFNEPPAPVYY